MFELRFYPTWYKCDIKRLTPKPHTRCDKQFILWDITWENSAMKSTRAILSYYYSFHKMKNHGRIIHEMSQAIHINSSKEILYFCVPCCHPYQCHKNVGQFYLSSFSILLSVKPCYFAGLKISQITQNTLFFFMEI